MAYGNHRFLINNIARTAYLASPSGVQASTIEPGRIGGVQKSGTGSAVWKAAGEFTGQQDLLIVEQIDAIGTGEVGSATFRWKTNLTTGVGNWEASGVSTDTDYTALGSDGKQVAWEQGSGADFVLYDSGVFECKALFGPGRLFDLDRDTYWQSDGWINLLSNANFESGFTGGLADGWTKYHANQTYTDETTTVHTAGGHAQKITCVDDDESQGIQQSITVTTGKEYYIEAWVYQNSERKVRLFHANLYGNQSDTTVPATTWTKITWHVTADATGAASLYIYNPALLCTVSDYLIIDDIRVFELPYLDFDLDSAQQITAIVLQDHNLSEDAVITLKGNSSESWGSPGYEENGFTVTDDPIIEYDGDTYQYWRWVFQDIDNTDGYIRISLAYLGTYTELIDAQAPWESSITTKRNLIENTSEVGIRRQRIYTTQRVFSLEFPTIDETDIDSLQTIWEATFDTDTGKVVPIWVHYFYDEADTLMLCRCTGEFEKEYFRSTIYNLKSLRFEEVPKSRV